MLTSDRNLPRSEIMLLGKRVGIFMHSIHRSLLCLALLGIADTALGQATVESSPKIEKDCIGLSQQARQECLKVAKQMDHEATTAREPATKPDSANSPSPNTVQHSSPVMQTPREIKSNQNKQAHSSIAPPAQPKRDNQSAAPAPH
jgi:hypothetical protein